MGTQVWFRNPHNYVKELVELGVSTIIWDIGLLHKMKIDPVKHAELYYGKAYPYRILISAEQGTAEYRPGDTYGEPTAVYPTWEYGENANLLEEIMAKPVGEDESICGDRSVPRSERPVLGQEHRVIITNIPNVSSGPGRNFLRFLKELQEDYPDCIVHVHNLYSYRAAFGLGFGSADFDPRTAAQKGKVYLPSGQEVKFEKAQANPKWVTALGYKPVDLNQPRVRCMFNIKSAMWAGANYSALFNFRTNKDSAPVDHESSDKDFTPRETKSPFTGKAVAKPGDKFQCNTCSLAPSCKQFRDGAVCSVPGAESLDLAAMFQSRDSGMIIDGLGVLVAANTRRLESGLREEEAFGDRNPEVTKMMNQIFTQGIQLAKLIDPSLRGSGVTVNVGGGGNANVVAHADPKQMVSAVFRQLQAQGIAAEDITPEMVQGVLENMNNMRQLPAAVQGTVISER